MHLYTNNISINETPSIADTRQHQMDNLLADSHPTSIANNSPRVQQLKSKQAAASVSPQILQLKAYQTMADQFTSSTAQRKENSTGLPDNLKSGIENLSGYSMDDVKVHYNSSQPAQLNAHAYAQGTAIHLASGQEKHLPHEAWHVVQQKQGRVKPTMQLKGKVAINDDAGLEHEADVMGAEAMRTGNQTAQRVIQPIQTIGNPGIAQLKGTKIIHKPGALIFAGKRYLVGLEMHANLDPDDPVTGSATTAENYDFMKGIRYYYSQAGVIRGHLLNHDLGGYGVPENLYPISSIANSSHSERVEQKVKGALSKSASGSKKDIKYTVVVEQKGRSMATFESADFKCKWTDENGNGHADVIESRLNIDKGWGGKSTGEKSPSKWRHGSRRGAENFSTQIGKKIGIDLGFLNGISPSDYGNLKNQTINSGDITDVQDWDEAVKMLENEIVELATVEDKNAPSDLFKKARAYQDWIKKEIAKATLSNTLGTLTQKESARMKQNLLAIRKERIYMQDGIDSESNIADESDAMDLTDV